MPEGIFIDYLCSHIFLLNNKSNEKFIYLLAVAAIVAACSGNKGYVVTGTVEGGADGDTVFCKSRRKKSCKSRLRSNHQRYIHL